MRGDALLLFTLAIGLISGNQSAFAASFRLVDKQGAVHFTNTPTDPRYQRQRESAGAGSGWAGIPENPQHRYADEIRRAAERYRVEATLVEAVIGVESAFNPWAVSRKGAQGLMQLIPQTAATLGVRDSFSPRQNIGGGVRHLRHLIDRYRGDLPLALAAYNAGAQAVDWYHGIPPYPETQQFVQRVLDRYGWGRVAGVRPQVIYRHEDTAGTVIYTNIPPLVSPSPFR